MKGLSITELMTWWFQFGELPRSATALQVELINQEIRQYTFERGRIHDRPIAASKQAAA